MKEAISQEEFNTLTNKLIGLTVSRAWFDYNSTIFLELGKLHCESLRDGKGDSVRGEATIMIESGWLVKGLRAVQLDGLTGEEKIGKEMAKLKGQKIVEIQIQGRRQELAIRLSGKNWLRSSTTTLEPHPEWALILSDGSWLCLERGRVIIEEE